MITLFSAGGWQMTAGERAALEGLLGQMKPSLAVEVGTAEGGSLACIASHAAEVHSFDLVAPAAEVAALDHVTLHTGDSHALLPAKLQEFALQGRNVDFVLIDGDHSSDGARRDLEDVVRSDAVRRTVIVLHDTANEEVRAGLEAAEIAGLSKVKAIDFDFVPGYLVKAEVFHHQIWGGLGLVLVDDSPQTEAGFHLISDIAYAQPEILAAHRARIEAQAEPPPLAASAPAVSELERRLATVTQSKSWRMTEPLRRIAAKLRA
jgi:Methyltransferase domain